eukprot:4488172-Amphidinium_carterae.1
MAVPFFVGVGKRFSLFIFARIRSLSFWKYIWITIRRSLKEHSSFLISSVFSGRQPSLVPWK